MTGRVDEQLRALIEVPLAASRDGPRQVTISARLATMG